MSLVATCEYNKLQYKLSQLSSDKLIFTTDNIMNMSCMHIMLLSCESALPEVINLLALQLDPATSFEVVQA